MQTWKLISEAWSINKHITQNQTEHDFANFDIPQYETGIQTDMNFDKSVQNELDEKSKFWL